MPTASGHTTAVLASKVKGTPVYNTKGEKVGTVEDIMLDKTSNNIMFAVLGSGGVLGIGEKYRPIPWSVLDYDQKMGGYIAPVDRNALERAPAYGMDELTHNDGSNAILSETYSYYRVPAYWE
jgi:sporulation protein YlmC with PRC-barrel domain